jgi:hypothetical protein
VDTLAYWVGCCDLARLDGLDALGITAAMARQYDLEEQADRLGRVGSALEPVRPVAPVQLVRAWSPVPLAVELHGEPDWMSAGTDVMDTVAVALAWNRPKVIHGTNAHRAAKLLAVAAMRAGGLPRRPGELPGVLLAAKPGWSYERAHPLSDETRRLMRQAGYALTDRHG